MEKKITIDGIDFGPGEIEAVRQSIIEVRDAAIEMARFDYAVPLSHGIALLAIMKKQMIKDNESDG